MEKFNSLEDAIQLATFAHRKQIDKAGMAYISHPLRVLATVQAMGGRPYVQMAAVLHDVTEDTSFTAPMLISLGFSEAVVQLVMFLDRNKSKDTWLTLENLVGGPRNVMTPEEFYYGNIKGNSDALMIKAADIRDNLAPWRLSYLPEETQERLKTKYAKAMDLLGIEEHD